MRCLIAIPCMDMVHTDFARALLTLERPCPVQFVFSSGSLVYDSRNLLADIAIRDGFDRVLWLDSDMDPAPDLLKRLSADLDEGKEIVAGFYPTRKPPLRPCAYQTLGMQKDGERETPVALPVAEWPEDRLFPAEGVGFGAVLMTTELLRRVRDAFGMPFSPILGFGEDLSFYLRARELGAEIWCDPRAKAGHIGLKTYRPEELSRETEEHHE